MIKGQVVAGDFSKIVMRVKASESIELGELVVIDSPEGKFILQVYDLLYASQLSPQNLEMVAGMNLEEEAFSLFDENLRNYQFAMCKALVLGRSESKTCKKRPP